MSRVARIICTPIAGLETEKLRVSFILLHSNFYPSFSFAPNHQAMTSLLALVQPLPLDARDLYASRILVAFRKADAEQKESFRRTIRSQMREHKLSHPGWGDAGASDYQEREGPRRNSKEVKRVCSSRKQIKKEG